MKTEICILSTALLIYYKRTITNEQHAEEAYGSWSKDSEYTIEGAALKSNPFKHYFHSSESITIAPDLKEGQLLWVLWAQYSTGDTFGRSSGLGEVLWAFESFEVARAAEQACQSQLSDTSFVFVDEENESIQLSNPGRGYFESTERVELTHVVIGELKPRR